MLLQQNILDFNYGLYPGENRYHVDQVPMEFGNYGAQTYNLQGQGGCWVTGSKVDMSKRQASLQLCFRAKGPQNVRPSIIFRAKPKIDENNELHPINCKEPSSARIKPELGRKMKGKFSPTSKFYLSKI